MPDAEQVLWHHVRAARLNGFKFRRQHPIPPYIVDFVCMDARVIVELDGSQHGADVDAFRQKVLSDAGFLVLRFWNNEVLSNTVVVLEVILRAVETRTLSPTPLPRGEG